MKIKKIRSQLKMQRILIVVFCCVCCKGAAQTTITVPTISVSPPTSNLGEFNSSNQAFPESTDATKDRFSCVLSILKNALAEELKKNYYRTYEEERNNVSSINNDIGEKQYSEIYENQLEKPPSGYENETNAISEYKKEIADKSSIVFNQNVTQQKSIEMPNMIPIFKQRSQPMNAQNYNVACSVAPKHQIPISKAVSFVPEKIIQTMNPIPDQELNHHGAYSSLLRTNTRQLEKSKATSFKSEQINSRNFNSIPSQTNFNVPCQRAVDILDMNAMIPCNKNTNVNSIANALESSTQNQIPVLPKCVGEDDTVAMLFKPKNISLQQVYGNLLKKVTITVLVPYHISKLGGK